MAFDPETIILSGPASADIMARVIAAADPLPQSISARNKRSLPRLMLGSAGISAAALGAAALPVFRDMVPDISAYR
jgi:predicted NBD/HSP70 family sugar kinase